MMIAVLVVNRILGVSKKSIRHSQHLKTVLYRLNLLVLYANQLDS